jgi:hypothetical protein
VHFCEFKFHRPSLSVAMTKAVCECESTGRSDMKGNYNKFKLIKPDSRVSWPSSERHLQFNLIFSRRPELRPISSYENSLIKKLPDTQVTVSFSKVPSNFWSPHRSALKTHFANLLKGSP